MSSLETAFSSATYAELETESCSTTTAPKITSKSLPLSALTIAPLVFQLRLLEDEYTQHESRKHIESLMNSAMIEPHKNLDPVVVWWSGSRWIVIDGHHRLEAYRRLIKLKKRNTSVHVEIFRGTLEEARRQAGKLNRKAKLPVTEEDKTNMSWRLVLTGKSSIRQTMEATGVGKGTVNRQRQLLKELREQRDDWKELIDGLTWRKVLHLGTVKEDYTDDDRDRKREQLVKVLRKNIYTGIVKDDPAIVFEAMIVVWPSMAEKGIDFFSESQAYGTAYKESLDLYEAQKAEEDDGGRITGYVPNPDF